MKRLILSVAVIALAASACKKNADKNFNARGTQAGALALPEKTIPGIVSSDLVLSNDTLWLLDGKVYVNNGATLVIQEGARIEGIKKATNAESSALIVTRGSQLFAVGNPDQPIVFSAHIDENNPSLEPGDWGGIVLLGKATVNKTEPTIEGIDLPTIPAGVDVHYGGTDDADNSGNLQYVRIEYAGAAIATDNELNGLTCGGVGCGTVLDFIESAYGADDAFEFFGGTVNAKHLYALAPNDDAFDFDNGYRGSVQFAVSQLRAELSYSANPNGIECDNDATGSTDQPVTKPQISNMTVIGLETATQAVPLWNAAYFRRNSRFNVKNSIFMGFPTGLNHESVNTDKNLSHNLITAYNTMVTPAGFPVVTGCGNAATDLIFTSGLNAPFAATPDYRPAAGSQAVTAGTDFSCFSGICEAGFIQSVNYRGAFDATNNWLAGWAKYDY